MKDKTMTTMTTNKFADALSNVASNRALSVTNQKRMSALALLARRADVAALLETANVDVTRIDARAIYASEKIVKFVAAIAQAQCSSADFNDNAFATFKTILQKLDAKQNVTFDDLRATISKSVKVKDDTSIFRRNTILSDATLSAQSQQCRDMLKTLNIVKEVSKSVFQIDAKSAILARARKQIKDLTL
jgi:hypothetical protein